TKETHCLPGIVSHPCFPSATFFSDFFTEILRSVLFFPVPEARFTNGLFSSSPSLLRSGQNPRNWHPASRGRTRCTSLACRELSGVAKETRPRSVKKDNTPRFASDKGPPALCCRRGAGGNQLVELSGRRVWGR